MAPVEENSIIFFSTNKNSDLLLQYIDHVILIISSLKGTFFEKMSRYSTPFLVLNLGSEMIFVVAQRLKAQNVSNERTNQVLDDLIGVLTSKPLITTLMKPQATYPHKAVREIIEDVAQCTVMRLDETSMSKLWDLITMVHRWQLTVCQKFNKCMIALTLRHLNEIENYTTNPNTLLQVHKVRILIENFDKMLPKDEKNELFYHVLYWLKDCNVRVSLLLRMGLQDEDGNFAFDDLSAESKEMLHNIGENIYIRHYSSEKNNNNNNKVESTEQKRVVNELDLFVEQVLSAEDGSHKEMPKLRLNIRDPAAAAAGENGKSCAFSRIDVTKGAELDDEVFDEHDDVEMNGNRTLRDDLIAMMGEDEIMDC